MSWTIFILFNGYLLLWIGMYSLFFKKKTTFRANRWILLGGLLMSAVLPFLVIHFPSEAGTSSTVSVGQPIVEEVSFPKIETLKEAKSFPMGLLTLGIYWIGVVISAFLFLKRLFSIYRLNRKHRIVKKGSVKHVIIPKLRLVFSFMHYLYAPEQIDPKVYAHELVHIRERHSIDTLLTEIVKVFCWFNPGIYLYQEAVKLNHEFLADATATNEHDLSEYADKLVGQSFKIAEASVVQPFFNPSHIQKRLIMLQKKRTTRDKVWTYLLLVPVLAGTVLITSSFSMKEKLDHTVREFLPKQQQGLFYIFSFSTDTLIHMKEVTIIGYTEKEVETLAPSNSQSSGQDSDSESSVDQRKMSEYFSRHATYPTEAREEQAQGNLVFQFRVNARSEVENIKRVSGEAGEALSQETVHLIQNLPKEILREHRNTQIEIPFQYRLIGP